MYGHVSKHVKMHKKPTGGTNKHGKHITRRSGKKKKEGHAWSDLVPGDTFQMVTLKQGHMGVKRNHTTTDTLRVSNAAKPRTKEASTSIKHRSKQA